jgi:cytochrome c peroxidase
MRQWRRFVVIALALSPNYAGLIDPSPCLPIPPTNLNYDQKVDLGRQLYFDGRLSKDGVISCAFCHNPGTAFAELPK